MMLFDSHAHYDDEKFDSCRDEIIKGLCQTSDTNPLGVCGVVNVGCDYGSSEDSLALARTYPFFYAACGVHPHSAHSAGEELEERLEALLSDPRAVALGEIGLDYHYDFSPREKQREVFRRQLSLAERLSLPVIVHDREAHGDCMDIVRRHKARGVFHSYSGSAEMARELVRLGYYVSFSGSVTFKNASSILEAVAAVPDDRIMIETDSPYLAPVPYRGKRNDSSFMYKTAEKLAEVRGVSVEHVARVTCENATRLFGIKTHI